MRESREGTGHKRGRGPGGRDRARKGQPGQTERGRGNWAGTKREERWKGGTDAVIGRMLGGGWDDRTEEAGCAQ